MSPRGVAGTGRARGSHPAVEHAAAGVLAWGAGLEAVPLAQATSERLALTVAALIAVAVLAVLGGLVVLLFRRQAQTDGYAGADLDETDDDEALWAPQHANGASAGSVRAPNGADPASGEDHEHRGAVHDEEAGDEAGAAAAPTGEDSPEEPVVRPPDPAEAWTAEITWVAHATRFRVVAHRSEDPGAAPVALAQTEPLPWPPKDDASVQALTDASRTLESVLLDSGWTDLPGGATWYSKRFAWTPQPAENGADPSPGSGRFERREPVPHDADAPRR